MLPVPITALFFGADAFFFSALAVWLAASIGSIPIQIHCISFGPCSSVLGFNKVFVGLMYLESRKSFMILRAKIRNVHVRKCMSLSWALCRDGKRDILEADVVLHDFLINIGCVLHSNTVGDI